MSSPSLFSRMFKEKTQNDWHRQKGKTAVQLGNVFICVWMQGEKGLNRERFVDINCLPPPSFSPLSLPQSSKLPLSFKLVCVCSYSHLKSSLCSGVLIPPLETLPPPEWRSLFKSHIICSYANDRHEHSHMYQVSLILSVVRISYIQPPRNTYKSLTNGLLVIWKTCWSPSAITVHVFSAYSIKGCVSCTIRTQKFEMYAVFVVFMMSQSVCELCRQNKAVSLTKNHFEYDHICIKQ